MQKAIRIISLLISITVANTAHTYASIGTTLDSVRSKIEQRIKNVYQAKLDAKYRQQALAQLRNMQSRYNSARNLSNIPSQKDAAIDMANQIRRELNTFDKRLNTYLLKTSERRTAEREDKES